MARKATKMPKITHGARVRHTSGATATIITVHDGAKGAVPKISVLPDTGKRACVVWSTAEVEPIPRVGTDCPRCKGPRHNAIRCTAGDIPA
jgi:hypothetical protein